MGPHRVVLVPRPEPLISVPLRITVRPLSRTLLHHNRPTDQQTNRPTDQQTVAMGFLFQAYLLCLPRRGARHPGQVRALLQADFAKKAMLWPRMRCRLHDLQDS